MKKSLITASVLSIFALLCALLLSLVNFWTNPIIKAKEEEKIKESIKYVCPLYDSSTMELVEVSGDAKTTYLVKENDVAIFAIYIIDATGFASTIEMMISVDKTLTITGYTVLSSAETKGDIKSHDFKMTGSNSLDTFDALSGSTVSSKAVKKCFRLALEYASKDLGGVQ